MPGLVPGIFGIGPGTAVGWQSGACPRLLWYLEQIVGTALTRLCPPYGTVLVVASARIAITTHNTISPAASRNGAPGKCSGALVPMK